MAVDGLTLDANYDPRTWLLVPMWLAHAPDSMRKPWVRQSMRRLGRPAGFFSGVLDIARDMSAHDQMWVLMPHGIASMLLMLVDHGPASDAPDVLDEMVAARPEQVEPPQVSSIDTAGLGRGTRVLRQDRNPDGTAAVKLYHHFETDGVVVVMNAQTTSLDELTGALPYVDSLIYGMRLVPALVSSDTPGGEQVRGERPSRWRRAAGWLREDS